jgi:hypothetical protein
MTPPEASTVSPGPLLVTGVASANAVAVEVRLRGASEWLPATLTGTEWEIELELPEDYRSWWIESRAIDAAGHYQAPVDRQRIETVLTNCVMQTLDITGIGMNGAETGELLVPTDALSATIQLAGAVYRDDEPDGAMFHFSDGTTVELSEPTRLIDESPDVSPFMTGYTFEVDGQPGLVEVEADDPDRTTQAFVAYSTVPATMPHVLAYTTTLQYAWGGNDGYNAVGPATLPITLPTPLANARDIHVQAVVIDKEPRQGSDQRIAIVQADTGNGVVAEEIITDPDEPHLNIVDLTLEAVPAGTEVITLSLISPVISPGESQWNNPEAGDSVFLIGGAVQYPCAGTVATQPVPQQTQGRQTTPEPLNQRMDEYETMITPEDGGMLEVGRFRITFPAGAVEEETRLVYSASPDLPQHLSNTIPTLRSFALGAWSSTGEPVTTFAQPYEMTLSYDEAELGTVGSEQEQIMLAYWDETSTRWKTVPQTIDTDARQVTASLDHFTEFVLVTRNPTTMLYLPFIIR